MNSLYQLNLLLIVNKSKIIELTEIINPNIINGLDLSIPLSLGILLEEDNLFSFLIFERLENALLTIKN